jgi:hypothetical protein
MYLSDNKNVVNNSSLENLKFFNSYLAIFLQNHLELILKRLIFVGET